jgi:hypothetical protein
MTELLPAFLSLVAATVGACAGLWVRAGRPVPFRAAAALFAVVVVAHGFYAGWASATLSAAAAGGALAILVFVGILSRSATYVTPVLAALLPVSMWWLFLPGLALLLFIAQWLLFRQLGAARAKSVAVDAMMTTARVDPESMAEMTATYGSDASAPKVNYFFTLSAGFALAGVALAVSAFVG